MNQIKQTHAVTKIVYSEASEHSYGGYIAEKMEDVRPKKIDY